LLIAARWRASLLEADKDANARLGRDILCAALPRSLAAD
jgi:hypothetical protein